MPIWTDENGAQTFTPGKQNKTLFAWLSRELKDRLRPAAHFSTNPQTTDGLVWGYTAGVVQKADGTLVNVPGGTITLPDDATRYVEYDPADDTVKLATGDFTTGCVPLRKISTVDGAITNLETIADDPRGALLPKMSLSSGGGDGDTLNGQDGAYYLNRAHHTGTQALATISDAGALAAKNTVAAADIDDGAATDAKIGNRSLDDATLHNSATGTLTQLLSLLAKLIKGITGQSSFLTAPSLTLSGLATHKARHAAGGPDALSPADIGAAQDSTVVHNTGNETIAGEKTFSSPVVVPDAVNANHAVSRAQLDAARAGLIIKESVRVASTGSVTISNPGTDTFDGVTLSLGEDILLKNQSSGAQNGIYVFNGSASALTRRSDADSSAEVKTGMAVWVSEGTANGDKRFVLTTNAPITLGTTALTFVQDSASSGVVSVSGGDGIASTGGASPSIALDTPGLVLENTLAEADLISFYDSSVAAHRKGTIEQLFAAARIFRSTLSVYTTSANAFILRRFGAPFGLNIDRANGSEGSESAVTSGNSLGTLGFRGWDGAAYNLAAYWEAVCNGTVASGQVPAYLRFFVRSSGGSSLETTRLSDAGCGFFVTSPTSDAHARSLATQYTSLSANTTLSAAHHTVYVDTSGANRTITLPDATLCPGREYVILKAHVANTLTIARTSSQTINGGAADLTITDLRSGYRLKSTGTAWEAVFVSSTGFATGTYVDPAYISGLGIEWVSSTSIKVTSGAAYVESANAIIALPSDSTLSPTLSASAWHYLYLKSDATIEVSTTAPAAPFRATARSKTSDTSRRYLGAVRTNASSQIYNFLRQGDMIFYREDIGASPFRALTNGTATTSTTVSLSNIVPPTSRVAKIRILNLATSAGGLYTEVSDGSTSGPPTSGLHFDNNANGTYYWPVYVDHVLNSSQALKYFYSSTPTGGGAYIDVPGYYDTR